jgi:hypothetical protein
LKKASLFGQIRTRAEVTAELLVNNMSAYQNIFEPMLFR